jgi:hypothetical protein
MREKEFPVEVVELKGSSLTTSVCVCLTEIGQILL